MVSVNCAINFVWKDPGEKYTSCLSQMTNLSFFYVLTKLSFFRNLTKIGTDENNAVDSKLVVF